jgi:hypothetical protein
MSTTGIFLVAFIGLMILVGIILLLTAGGSKRNGMD